MRGVKPPDRSEKVARACGATCTTAVRQVKPTARAYDTGFAAPDGVKPSGRSREFARAFGSALATADGRMG